MQNCTTPENGLGQVLRTFKIHRKFFLNPAITADLTRWSLPCSEACWLCLLPLSPNPAHSWQILLLTYAFSFLLMHHLASFFFVYVFGKCCLPLSKFWIVTHLSVDWHWNKRDDMCGIKPNHLNEVQIFRNRYHKHFSFPQMFCQSREKKMIFKRVMFLDIYTVTHIP